MYMYVYMYYLSHSHTHTRVLSLSIYIYIYRMKKTLILKQIGKSNPNKPDNPHEYLYSFL